MFYTDRRSDVCWCIVDVCVVLRCCRCVGFDDAAVLSLRVAVELIWYCALNLCCGCVAVALRLWVL